MSYKIDQNKEIREALHILNYRYKVRHGKGTSAAWVKIYIPKSVWARDEKMVEQIVAQALGRTTEDNNHIAVYWYE